MPILNSVFKKYETRPKKTRIKKEKKMSADMPYLYHHGGEFDVPTP